MRILIIGKREELGGAGGGGGERGYENEMCPKEEAALSVSEFTLLLETAHE